MKQKTFTLQCDSAEAAQLAEALSVYAQAAYPPGGSACAQVSREALLSSAQQIASEAAGTQGAQLRKRQRAMFKAAVDWYFSDDGPGDAALATRMQQLLRR